MQPDSATPADAAPLFETLNVSKAYGAYMALRDVSFRVSDGEFVSIVGPNGAGKTTLINVVTGLLKPTRGEVEAIPGSSVRVQFEVAGPEHKAWLVLLGPARYDPKQPHADAVAEDGE